MGDHDAEHGIAEELEALVDSRHGPAARSPYDVWMSAAWRSNGSRERVADRCRR